MKLRWGFLGFWLLLLGVGSAAWATPVQQRSLRAPLRFEPNRGQSDPQVRFLARGEPATGCS